MTIMEMTLDRHLLTLQDGLLALPNVDKPTQWLVTDASGWLIYALIEQDQETGMVTLTSRWQLGWRLEGNNLILFKQASPYTSPFVDEVEQRRRQRLGKRFGQYTSFHQQERRRGIDDR